MIFGSAPMAQPDHPDSVRHHRLTGSLCMLLAWIAFGLMTPAALAQPVVPAGELSTLVVPGGAWALAELGVPPSVERASALRLLVQRRYDASPSVRLNDEAIARVQAQLDLAVQIEQAARLASPGGVLSLGAVKTRPSRDRLREAIEAIGGRLRQRRGQYSVELADGRRERDVQAALRTLGLDVAGLAARLNQGETVALEVPAARLPLAFTTATWTQVVFERDIPARGLFAELLRDPNALLLWHGALALDPSTRRFLEASPELLRVLHREAAPLFSAYSANLAVRNGRIQLAGGDHVQTLWEGLVNESIAAPAAFVRRLFTRDGGRLAVFFDLIQALPAPQRDFATGAWIRDPGQRLDRFRALYAAVSRADADWAPAIAPLKRYPADPWLLLRGLVTAPEAGGNGLAGPQQRRFWERAFADGWPDDVARALRDVDDDGIVDAAWLVERVCNESLSARPARFQQVLAIARAFPSPSAADLPGVLLAARGLAEFPALLLVLERGGVLTPALAAAAVRQATLVQQIGDRDRRTIAIAQLQGAVALVDGLRAAGALTVERATSLLAALLAVPLRGESFGAGIAVWLVDGIVPALPSVPGAALDAVVVAALAVQLPRGDKVRWEGGDYVVDWNGAERERLSRLRLAQGGVTVDDVASLVRLIRRVEEGPPAPAKARDEMQAILEAEKTIGRPRGLDEIAEPLELTRVLPQARRELERVRGPRDLDHAARAAERLSQAAEWLTAHLLLTLAYTPHLGDPAGPAARAGELALRHRFGAHDVSESTRLTAPWALPVDSDVSGISGAILGLDHAMARLSLRRLSSAAPPAPTLLTTANQHVLALQVAGANPREAASAPVREVAAALARGRDRLQRAQGTAAALDTLAAEAAMGGDRRSLLAWTALEEPTRVADGFTQVELVRLGAPAVEPPAILGTPTLPFDTRLGLAWRPAEPWENYSGRPSLGLLAAATPELPLRIADWLTEAGLPPALYPGVLAFATQDLIDAAALSSSEDWLGFVRQVRGLTRERFDDYVSALAGLGILTPGDGATR
jgi:hypothetical protein